MFFSHDRTLLAYATVTVGAWHWVLAGSDLKYYESAAIWCRDGSTKFSKDRLNDNFCDCEDGTDEPGMLKT